MRPRRAAAVSMLAALSAVGGCGSCHLESGEGGAAGPVDGGDASARTDGATWGRAAARPRAGWLRALAGASSTRPVRVAVDPAGGVVVVGSFAGSFDLGTGAVSAQPGAVAGRTDDAFVARFDGEGAPIFARAFGDASAQTGEAVAVDVAAGAVLFGGSFGGRLGLGPGLEAAAAGASDGFVARLDPGGVPRALRAVAGPGVEVVRGLAVDSRGALFAGGTFTGAGPFASIPCPGGSLCGFAAELGTDGAPRAGVVVRAAAATLLPVAAPDGRLVVAGTARGAARIEAAAAGGGGLDVPCADEAGRAFVASVVEGQPRWARCVGDGPASEVSVAVAADGTVFVAAAEQARAGRDSTAPPRDDVRVAAFSADGQPRWSKLFGDAERQTPRAIAAGPRGPVVVGGMFGTIDFGGGPLASDDAVDAFVVELSAHDGSASSARRFGGGGSQEAFGVAVLPDGAIAVAGLFDGTLRAPAPADAGPVAPVDAKSRFDVFVAVLPP